MPKEASNPGALVVFHCSDRLKLGCKNTWTARENSQKSGDSGLCRECLEKHRIKLMENHPDTLP